MRVPSPALSENGVDIADALAGGGGFGDFELEADKQHPDRKARILAAEEGIPGLDDSDSDDAGFIADTQASANRKTSNIKSKSLKKGGGFQAMGLNTNLLKAITRKGFSVPTPIQRKTIPLVLDGQDVVGMARTGSGKTAAFVVPMIEKLKSHSAKVGARALILSPSRELALQTLKVVKEFGRGTDLKCVLLVGGDSLEEQFGFMSSNPDIVIATPGRFLHLKVEMGLDLSSVRYVVFDEADRLFEMGFATQLTEILHALPSTRQTLLFSATLPKSLIEFARAGLQEPHLVRLDAESKISPDLESAFFTIKSAEKEGALLHILSDIINIPTGETQASIKAKEEASKPSKKRKRTDGGFVKTNESPTEHSTIIFAATKHHVDYLAALLRQTGYAVSYAYGSLDQTARKIQVQDFRTGMSNILVVTDVAARGIDIPILANVINYDFPGQPKIFVHRVGRTARAGQKGWAYSLVRESDIPYLLDLQLFLSRKLVLGKEDGYQPNFSEDVVVGGLQRDKMERSCEWVNKVLEEDIDIHALRGVAAKGEKLYLRTRNAASTESVRRAKEVTSSNDWTAQHHLFSADTDNLETERAKMLARVSSFRPPETVFEIGKRGAAIGEVGEVVKKRRRKVDAHRQRKADIETLSLEPKTDPTAEDQLPDRTVTNDKEQDLPELDADMSSASSDELEVTLSHPTSNKSNISFKDPSFFMSYTPTNTNLAEDRAYSVHTGGTSNSNPTHFLTAAATATMDLANDDTGGSKAGVTGAKGMRWDKKSKKYVSRANDEDGSKGTKYIRGESGQKIAASFRSGRYDAWKKVHKVERLPRTGEMEKVSNGGGGKGVVGGERRWRHQKQDAPKEADRFRDDYYKKRKMVEKAKEEGRGRFKDGGKSGELKGMEAVRKDRALKEKRREKTGKGKKGRGRGRG